ncbi:putative RNA polymerase II mediator complex component Srb8 [Tricladium varicosporioides]|nr:putative RNA polymerase II mediator complex component Srb8 [Hymenoscyphus varicosporioides]
MLLLVSGYLALPCFLVTMYIIIKALYQLFWSPLSKFSGPKLWAITQLPFVFTMTQGQYGQRVRELHRKYGDIVRLGPNELSFAHPDAWTDIHQRRPGKKSLLKNPIYISRPEAIPAETFSTTPSDSEHNRMRRVFEGSFSDKAIRAQEPIIRKSTGLFIEKLRSLPGIAMGNPINMGKWFTFATFDVFGDLAFGEPFGCVESGKYHEWVSLGTEAIKLMTWSTALKHYPWVYALAMKMIPKAYLDKGRYHYEHTVLTVSKRMSIERQQEDFMTPILKANHEFKSITLEELYCNFALLIWAASETSATVISGITYKLSQNPDVLKKLEKELLANFGVGSEMPADRLKELPYLNAVIYEGMRMCNPAPPGNPRIVPEGGARILNHFIPAGTSVSVHPFTLHYSEKYFSLPQKFRPDRWLDPKPSDIENHDPAAMNVFGMGLRRCLGEKLAWFELRLIVASIVLNFSLSSGYGDQPLDWEAQKSYFVIEREPMMVRLQIRK